MPVPSDGDTIEEINIVSIAMRLGCTLSQVKEAFQELKDIGLIDFEPVRGEAWYRITFFRPPWMKPEAANGR